MPDLEFFFAVDVSDEASFNLMLNQVAAAVLGYAGCAGARLAEVSASLRKALTAAADSGHQPCHVQFQAHGGELLIAVSCAGRPEWRTTLPVPTE